MATVHRTSCSLNCWDHCGFKVTVENQKVKKVEGDDHHPITKGKICGRGIMLETRTNAKDRITHPLKKVNGEFREISWQQALDEIAVKMAQLRQAGPTTALLHSHDYANNGLLKNLDKRFFNCFGGVTELTGSLCWGAGIEAQFCDFGNALSHSPDDLDNSKAIVIWGRNSGRTNFHLFQKLTQMKKQGIPIVVIDPLYNQTAKLADHHISIRPGMDSLLAFGVMKKLLEQGLEDHRFIKNHTIGFTDLTQTLDSLSYETIYEQAGVTKRDLTVLVEAYTNRPAATFIGLGMQRYENGGNTIRAIDALVAMSGNVGVPGGGANYANLAVGQSFSLDKLTCPERKQHHRFFTRMGQAEAILKNGDIKMMFVTRSNPLVQVPDTNVVHRAFTNIETIVVIDQFMTDTAALADYVLPCTTVFEEEDIYYSSMYHHYVHYGPKLAEPKGEAMNEVWIWQQLSERLGFGADFNYTIAQFLKMGLTDLEKAGITLEKIKEEHYVALPVPSVPWADHIFQTPSGKYEFTSDRAGGKIELRYPASHNQEEKSEFPYTLLSIHPGRSNHSQHYPLIKQIQAISIEVAANIALEHNLENGERITVYNRRGELSGVVRILEQAHPNTINIDEGNWHKFGGSVNVLTSSKASDNGLGSTFYDCLVQVKRQ